MSKSKVDKWLEADGLLLLEAWARDGLDDGQIAKNCGVNRRTLWEWKKKYPPINHALSRARAVVDVEVENALYKKATGFSVKIKKPQKVHRVKYDPITNKKSEEYDEYIDVEEEQYTPPDVKAQIFWLTNRKPETWKEKQTQEIAPESELTVTVSKELDDFLK